MIGLAIGSVAFIVAFLAGCTGAGVTISAASGGGNAPPTYSVTYSGNGATGGSVPVDNKTYAKGATVTVLGNTGNLADSGETFVGWNTASNGSGSSDAAGTTFTMGSANVTLYAQWTTSTTYKVTYNVNGATSGTAPTDSNNYVAGATVTVLGNTGNLAESGYTFNDWNTAANGSGTNYVAGDMFMMGSANVTLYAEWTPLPWTWTDQSAAGSRFWQSITFSSDGTHLAAVVASGGIYASADSGANWTDITPSGVESTPNWTSIASSSDGTQLAAVDSYGSAGSGGDIWTAVNSGGTWTWTDQTAAGARGWSWIASSSDGTHLAAVDGANIWTGVDSGGTWTWTNQTSGTSLGGMIWQSIASSSDGTHLAAVASYGDIYTSTDSGVTWSDVTPSGAEHDLRWTSIASSPDGTHLVATDGGSGIGGDIYTSSDSGATWTDVTSSGAGHDLDWNVVAMSSDGTHLAAVYGSESTPGDVYTSSDSGVTWTHRDPSGTGSQRWASIASSSDGTHLAAAGYAGDIWTGVYN